MQEDNDTSCRLSIKHHRMLVAAAEKNRRGVQAQLEIFIEEGVSRKKELTA